MKNVEWRMKNVEEDKPMFQFSILHSSFDILHFEVRTATQLMSRRSWN